MNNLKSNTASLQAILETINSLPEAGGVELPELTDPAMEGEIFLGKEVIDEEGNVKTGTFTIENELSNQSDLITQLQTMVDGLPEVGAIVVDDVSKSMIEKTITEIRDDRVEKIGPNAFRYCLKLTSVNFPVCTSIEGYAFCNCYSLASINFPTCTSIGNFAFQSCYSLTSINFPAVTEIGIAAFMCCYSLTSINFPVTTLIKGSVFQNCFSLTSVNFPACTSIQYSAFQNCSNLTSINFPACISIGNSTFYNCSKLTSVNFPVATTISTSAFANCSNLTSINFPTATTIGSYAFNRCSVLSHFQLGASSVCKLSHSNTFGSTPFAGYSTYFSGTPYIYVPASLVSAYQSATNWTYFSSYFSSIESLENN